MKNMLNTISLNPKITDIVFWGRLNLESVSIWMNASDILCLPSYSDGLPNVINKALACNKKLIASSVGGIPEMMIEKGLFSLVEPRNHIELYNCIKKVTLDEGNDFNVPRLNSWGSHAPEVSEIFRIKMNHLYNY